MKKLPGRRLKRRAKITAPRAVHLEMESFERQNFVIWQGACGDAARAPLAVRAAVQGAKDQAHI